mgnify:CR=1 FL=1
MATVKDLANRTGLGLATISKYLNGGHVLERNKIAIEKAIEELDFTVNEFARGLKVGRSHTIGVIIPELSNVFITSIITVVEDFLRKKGYGVIICDCRTNEEQEAESVRFLVSKMVDGIINMPVCREGTHLQPALEKNIPVVLIDRMISDLKGQVNAVLVDNVRASSSAVLELIQAGHKHIGIILGPKDIFTSQQRRLGYQQAFIENNLMPDESLTVFSDYTVQGGYESMNRLLDRPDISAVFVTNYEMTLGAMIAANERGIKIPEQLSFIGFDNLQLSQVIRPKLTIVTQPLEEIGKQTAEILLEQLVKEPNQRKTKIVTLSASVQLGESVQKYE